VAEGRVFRPGEYPPWQASDSLVAFERRALFDNVVWHEHACFELALVLEGGGVRGLGDVVEACEDGDLCLSAGGTPHGCSARRPGAPVRAMVVHFSRAAVAGALAAPELGTVRALLERARQGVVVGGGTRDLVVREMLRLLGEPPGSWRRPVRLLDALGLIATSVDVRTVLAPRSGRSADLGDARLREVSGYVEECGLQDISHREAAARAGLSPSAFSRFFRRVVGRTFEDYVNDLRIAAACRLLVSSRRPVLEIAFASGFNSAAHFNRRFRRAQGMAPSAYRRRHAAIGEGHEAPGARRSPAWSAPARTR
jgi:AraC-like DNA-binding protein